jgi:hypothetical protein
MSVHHLKSYGKEQISSLRRALPNEVRPIAEPHLRSLMETIKGLAQEGREPVARPAIVVTDQEQVTKLQKALARFEKDNEFLRNRLNGQEKLHSNEKDSLREQLEVKEKVEAQNILMVRALTNVAVHSVMLICDSIKDVAEFYRLPTEEQLLEYCEGEECSTSELTCVFVNKCCDNLKTESVCPCPIDDALMATWLRAFANSVTSVVQFVQLLGLEEQMLYELGKMRDDEPFAVGLVCILIETSDIEGAKGQLKDTFRDLGV